MYILGKCVCKCSQRDVREPVAFGALRVKLAHQDPSLPPLCSGLSGTEEPRAGHSNPGVASPVLSGGEGFFF